MLLDDADVRLGPIRKTNVHCHNSLRCLLMHVICFSRKTKAHICYTSVKCYFKPTVANDDGRHACRRAGPRSGTHSQSHQPPPPSARGDERRTLAQVTRRRRRRRGWPWPEARFRPLMARQVMEPRTERSLWSLPTGAIRHRRACERSESSGAARRRTRPPGQPAGDFTRGLRAIAAFRRSRPRTGR